MSSDSPSNKTKGRGKRHSKRGIVIEIEAKKDTTTAQSKERMKGMDERE